jgi:hypothetical protein
MVWCHNSVVQCTLTQNTALLSNTLRVLQGTRPELSLHAATQSNRSSGTRQHTAATSGSNQQPAIYTALGVLSP